MLVGVWCLAYPRFTQLSFRDLCPQAEKRAAYRAMVTCPMGAIRLRKPDPLVKDVIQKDFPIAVDVERLPGGYRLPEGS
jgi:hypothetical protein